VLALVVWWLVKGFSRGKVGSAEVPPERSVRGEDMVACARCGVNLPRSDAREDAGRFYCVNNPHCRP
jgi:uncharacterized protein